MESKQLYSYHTFIFPFVCEGKDKIDEIFNNDSSDNIWEEDDDDTVSNSQKFIKADEIEDKIDEYNKYKFFNEAGRKLVFRDATVHNVKNYKVKEEYVSGYNYIIGYEDGEYKLPIRDISLKFYSTEIIVFVLECENYDYKSIEDIKRINEYGRRLGLPYWPPKGKTCKKCSKQLRISKEGVDEDLSWDNFQEELGKDGISLAYVSKIIRKLLDRNGLGYLFRGKLPENEKEIQMKALLEEKMYVATYICDDEFCNRLYLDFYRNKGFSSETQKSLVELMRVDLPNESSIEYKEELDSYLKEHLYSTAFSKKSKKLTMVTDQAYVKVVPEPDYEEGYFHCAYVPLLIIPIIQRNSIEWLHNKIHELTDVADEKINMSIIRRIINLQKRYVIFRNQYMPGLVTAQKEGKFLYSTLQKEFSVKDESDVLEKQMGKLFELANTNQSYAFSKWGLSLSLTSLTFSLISFINTAQNISKIGIENYSGWHIILIALSIVCIIIFTIIFGVFNSRRKKR